MFDLFKKHFDKHHLEEILEYSDNDLTFIEEILVLFITTSTETLEQLKQSLATKNNNDVPKLLHLLKGTSSNVGAIYFSNLCKNFEEQFIKNEIIESKMIFQTLSQSFEELKLLIHSISNKHPTLDQLIHSSK